MLDTHSLYDLISLGSVIATPIVGWLIRAGLNEIKLEQGKVKEELVASQSAIKADLTAKHAENKAAIEAHQREDTAIFNAIKETQARTDSTLARMDDKLDRALVNGGTGRSSRGL